MRINELPLFAGQMPSVQEIFFPIVFLSQFKVGYTWRGSGQKCPTGAIILGVGFVVISSGVPTGVHIGIELSELSAGWNKPDLFHDHDLFVKRGELGNYSGSLEAPTAVWLRFKCV